MENFNYSGIRPLITESYIEDRYLYVTFKCTKTGKLFYTSTFLYSLKKTGEYPQAELSEKGFLKKIRKIILPVLGKNPHPSIQATQINSDVDLDNPTEEIKSALIICFRQILKFFRWDYDLKLWFYIENEKFQYLNFIEFLEEVSIEKSSDKLIFSRMLVEMAMADEELAKEEIELLNTYLPPEYSSFQELHAMPALKTGDLLTVADNKIRELMLMICWALALTDQNLKIAEIERIDFYSRAFGINSNRLKMLKYFAQEYIIEKLIEQLYTLEYKDKEIIVSLNDMSLIVIKNTSKNIGLTSAEVDAIIESNKSKLAEEVTLHVT